MLLLLLSGFLVTFVLRFLHLLYCPHLVWSILTFWSRNFTFKFYHTL